MNKHGVSRRWFTEVDVKDFKSGALTKTGFELNVSGSQNAIYFSIIAIPKKSHFAIFAIQNFAQSTKEKHVNSIYIVGIMIVRYINGA